MTDVTNIRVAIFEPTRMTCEIMSHALESSCNYIRVVATGTSSEVRDSPQLLSATVVVINSTLQDGPFSGFTLLRRLTKASYERSCVLIVDRAEAELVVEAFRSGAVGVCECDQTVDQLCRCIACVHDGQVWANSQQVRYVLAALSNGTWTPPYITDAKGQILLTRREMEIVCKVAEGMKNREIAVLLELSEHTVKNHLFHIYERLGISSRAELILYLYSQRSSRDRSGTHQFSCVDRSQISEMTPTGT